MPTERKLIDLSMLSIVKFFLVILVLYFLYLIKDVLAILFVALIFASAVDPWVDKLEKIKFPRWLSILLIYIVLILIIFFAIYLLVPALVTQMGQLAGSFPQVSERVEVIYNAIKNFSIEHGISNSLGEGFSSLQENVTSAVKSIFTTLFSVFGGIVSFILILVITFYMTVEESALKRALTFVVPDKFQNFTLQLINKVQVKIGAWLKGQLILCLIVGLMVYVGLLILGVNYALILGLVAGILELIPYVGPIISAIPAIFLAFTQSPIKALFVLILYIIVQQLENNLIVPKVMQRAVGLNPIICIVALLIGAKVGGVVGVLLAIPVATAISVIIKELWQEKERREETIETVS